MKTTTLPLRNLMNRSPLRAFLLILFVLACFGLSPAARAVDPPPDGGYPGNNTAEGTDALFSLTTGTDNTALGFDALYSNTTGLLNTATGSYSLFLNTTGAGNTATGGYALYHNTEGYSNTALGLGALYENTTGYANTAAGEAALQFNTTGFFNTACGDQALLTNTTGNSNTAVGLSALVSNTIGNNNTATGVAALVANTTGNNNTADGFNALLRSTGSNNIGVGYQAGSFLTTGNNNIHIGHQGLNGDANTIRIGRTGTHTKTFVAGIYGATTSGGIAVYINSSGKLGTTTSSARFKERIRDMGDTSDVLFSLRPVAFRYKTEVDPGDIPQFGLVAEEVEKVNPDLVARDDQGKPYTVRYEAVNAMLLNEFLKEHRKVEEQEATITQLKKEMKTVVARLEEQAAQIQKVSAHLELNKTASQIVLNNQ
jgi:hypothetical protein